MGNYFVAQRRSVLADGEHREGRQNGLSDILDARPTNETVFSVRRLFHPSQHRRSVTVDLNAAWEQGGGTEPTGKELVAARKSLSWALDDQGMDVRIVSPADSTACMFLPM